MYWASVSLTGPEPSVLIRQISSGLHLVLTNAIFMPSGDHSGSESFASLSVILREYWWDFRGRPSSCRHRSRSQGRSCCRIPLT